MKNKPAIISWKNYAAQTYDFIADKSYEYCYSPFFYKF